MSHTLAYYRVNVAGLVNVLEAMLRYGTPTIVFSSSCEVFRPLLQRNDPAKDSGRGTVHLPE